MAVPEEIRKVKRPVNTVVVDTGNHSFYRYAVRERNRSVYIKDHNPSPRNGKIIGHIINGEYVAVKKEKREVLPDMLSYGGAALVKSVSEDILLDLMKVYDAKKGPSGEDRYGFRIKESVFYVAFIKDRERSSYSDRWNTQTG